MEAKPILLIRVNGNIVPERGFYNTDGTAEFSFVEQMEKKFDDYHVLCIRDILDELITLEVFNIKDIKESTIEEFKNQIKDVLNGTNRN